jgi:hypothetical protein
MRGELREKESQMKRRVRWSHATIALAVIAAAIAGPLSTAQAHNVTFKSIVEIDGYQTIGAFIGAIGSFDNSKCSRARVVTVWKRNPGAMDGPFGTAKTNRAGRWRLEVTAPAANYYATVKKKAIRRKRGHRHVCSYDRSSNFRVP